MPENEFPYTPESLNLEDKLEKKRFLLSDNEQIRERLDNLQELINELKEEHPEIVGMTVFGSSTLGYSSKSSDIDGHIIIDLDIPGKISNKETSIVDLQESIKKQIVERLKIRDYQVDHIGFYATHEDSLREASHNDPTLVAPLFRLSIGTGIEKLRRIVLEELDKMGAKGENTWHQIMQYIWEKDSYRMSSELEEKRKELYPWTLAEAKEVYLRRSDR
jgi:hypothetical protein